MAGVKGRSGRKPKPVREHMLRGTYRADRHAAAKALADRAARGPVPKPPAIVRDDPESLSFWKRNAKHCHALGTLDALSAMPFALVAIHWSDYRRLSAYLDKNGHTYTTDRGVERLRPEFKMAYEAMNDFIKHGQEFGLSPMGRKIHGLGEFAGG